MMPYRSILAIAFAFLVLFSSSSFMVGIHRCGGKIQNMALFSKAEVCAMEKMMPPCHKHESNTCCEDESIIHEGQGFKNSITPIQIDGSPVSAMLQPAVFIAEIIPTQQIVFTTFHPYDPPLPCNDITVAFQVFLI